MASLKKFVPFNYQIEGTMKKVSYSKSFVIFLILLIGFNINRAQESQTAPYKTEEINIELNQFNIWANLYIPSAGDKHPLIIFVAGDGNSSREESFLMLKSYGYFDLFIEDGFAVLIDDKPGSGKSTGKFTRGSLFHERAAIVAKWIEKLKNHSSIISEQIGLAGGSQAGYVMPLVCEMNEGVAFMICQSCPAMNSINQSAFLIKQQTMCAGQNSEDAEKAYKYYIQSCMADNYQEYLEAATFLAANPIVKALGWDYIQKKEEFTPIKSNSESLFDPTVIFKKIRIPILAMYGTKDKLIDPVQGFEEFKDILKETGNKLSRVELIPDADHMLTIAETGCLSEMMQKRQKKEIRFCEEASNIVTGWLKTLKAYLNN